MSTPISDLAAILAPRPVIGLPVKTTMVVRRARGVVHSISATSGQVMVSVGHSTASLAVPATVPRHVVLTVGDVVTVEMFGTRVVVSGVITRGRPPWILATSGPPTSGTWLAQQLVLDSNEVLWICTSGGTPGTWMLVSGTVAGRMYATSQVLVTSAAGHSIPTLLTDFLLGGMTRNSNSLVVPIAGIYAVSALLIWQASGGSPPSGFYETQIWKNGAQVRALGGYHATPTDTWPIFEVQDLVSCAAGDALQLYGYTDVAARVGWGYNATHPIYLSAALIR